MGAHAELVLGVLEDHAVADGGVGVHGPWRAVGHAVEPGKANPRLILAK